MTARLRVGIVGCGNMGRRHARAHAHHADRVRIVACFDVVPAAAEALASQYSCSAEPTLEALLSRQDIDAVSVCTVETQHLEPVLSAARAGKHILLEKPIAIDLAEAEAMKAAAAQAGVCLMIGHLYRFDHRCREAWSEIQSGTIGRTVSIDCRIHGTPAQQDRIRNVDVSVFVFRGCHGIDLMRWFSGSEPVRIYAERVEGRLKSLGYRSDDALFCLMRFANGTVGSIEVNAHAPRGHPTAGRCDVTVVGTDGMIELNLAAPWMTVSTDAGLRSSQGNQKDLWFREEIGAFVEHVRHGGPNPATADDAMAALRISLAAVESAEKHVPVLLPEVRR